MLDLRSVTQVNDIRELNSQIAREENLGLRIYQTEDVSIPGSTFTPGTYMVKNDEGRLVFEKVACDSDGIEAMLAATGNKMVPYANATTHEDAIVQAEIETSGLADTHVYGVVSTYVSASSQGLADYYNSTYTEAADIPVAIMPFIVSNAENKISLDALSLEMLHVVNIGKYINLTANWDMPSKINYKGWYEVVNGGTPGTPIYEWQFVPLDAEPIRDVETSRATGVGGFCKRHGNLITFEFYANGSTELDTIATSLPAPISAQEFVASTNKENPSATAIVYLDSDGKLAFGSDDKHKSFLVSGSYFSRDYQPALAYVDDHYAETVVIGDVRAFAALDPGDEWLLCDGKQYNRVDYPDLYAAIGLTYSPDGITSDKFAVPDLTDKFIEGVHVDPVTGEVTDLGFDIEAGLPNIEGGMLLHGSGSTNLGSQIASVSGALISTETKSRYSPAQSNTGANSVLNVKLDASKNGTDPIYGNSDTVQPPALKLAYYIRAKKTDTYTGGATALRQLGDVYTPAPASGDALVFDADTQKWVASDRKWVYETVDLTDYVTWNNTGGARKVVQVGNIVYVTFMSPDTPSSVLSGLPKPESGVKIPVTYSGSTQGGTIDLPKDNESITVSKSWTYANFSYATYTYTPVMPAYSHTPKDGETLVFDGATGRWTLGPATSYSTVKLEDLTITNMTEVTAYQTGCTVTVTGHPQGDNATIKGLPVNATGDWVAAATSASGGYVNMKNNSDTITNHGNGGMFNLTYTTTTYSPALPVFRREPQDQDILKYNGETNQWEIERTDIYETDEYYRPTRLGDMMKYLGLDDTDGIDEGVEYDLEKDQIYIAVKFEDDPTITNRFQWKAAGGGGITQFKKYKAPKKPHQMMLWTLDEEDPESIEHSLEQDHIYVSKNGLDPTTGEPLDPPVYGWEDVLKDDTDMLVGQVMPYAGDPAALTDYWMVCDGRVLKRSAYQALFSVISTSYNTGGEAADEFRIPDLRNRFIEGTPDSSASGGYHEKPGLPNINGHWEPFITNIDKKSGTNGSVAGAFDVTNANPSHNWRTADTAQSYSSYTDKLYIDASKGQVYTDPETDVSRILDPTADADKNLIVYGKSNTVQPDALRMVYVIRVRPSLIHTTIEDVVIGDIRAFGSDTVPDNWLVCDGSPFDKLAYPELYTAIGDKYGTSTETGTVGWPLLPEKEAVLETQYEEWTSSSYSDLKIRFYRRGRKCELYLNSGYTNISVGAYGAIISKADLEAHNIPKPELPSSNICSAGNLSHVFTGYTALYWQFNGSSNDGLVAGAAFNGWCNAYVTWETPEYTPSELTAIRAKKSPVHSNSNTVEVIREWKSASADGTREIFVQYSQIGRRCNLRLYTTSALSIKNNVKIISLSELASHGVPYPSWWDTAISNFSIASCMNSGSAVPAYIYVQVVEAPKGLCFTSTSDVNRYLDCTYTWIADTSVDTGHFINIDHQPTDGEILAYSAADNEFHPVKTDWELIFDGSTTGTTALNLISGKKFSDYKEICIAATTYSANGNFSLQTIPMPFFTSGLIATCTDTDRIRCFSYISDTQFNESSRYGGNNGTLVKVYGKRY